MDPNISQLAMIIQTETANLGLHTTKEKNKQQQDQQPWVSLSYREAAQAKNKKNMDMHWSPETQR